MNEMAGAMPSAFMNGMGPARFPNCDSSRLGATANTVIIMTKIMMRAPFENFTRCERVGRHEIGRRIQVETRMMRKRREKTQFELLAPVKVCKTGGRVSPRMRV